MISLNLPAEILETIFLDLPHVSLLSCSKAAPQFAQIIHRDGFLDKYCQKVLQADWVNWQMMLTTSRSFPPVLEMWYLSSVTSCHPNLTVKACDSLHSIGIFIYILYTWLVNNKQIESKSQNMCTECHGTEFIQSVISNSDACQLFMKLAIAVPEFIYVTLLNCRRNAFCEGSKPFNWHAVDYEFLESHCCNYYLEIVLVEKESENEFMAMLNSSDESENLFIMSAFLVIGEDSWIGWSGHVDYTYFTNLGTFSSCNLQIISSFHDTEAALKQTFGNYVDCFESYGISFRGWKYAVEEQKVPQAQESLWVDIHFLLENLALGITKKIKRLGMQEGARENLKRYLDMYLQRKAHHGTAKWSSTLFVSILRYLHRVLNGIFYTECMKYLQNKDCVKYLAYSRQLEEIISQLKPSVRFQKKLSIHNLPPKLWPRHLLVHVMTAAPVVSRLVQLDIVLWTKGLHCQPVPNKIRQFLIEQTESCGLNYTMCEYPPLCGLVCYSCNDGHS